MARSVYEELREAIVSGALPPGSPLVETALAGQYGISRTPVREALLKLRQDGLVEPSGRGLAVSRRSPEEILEIYEMRVLLEEYAARSAAAHRTELDLSRLVNAQRVLAETADSDTAARVRANAEFHEQIWASSHNRTLCDLLDRINVQLRRYPETTLTYPGRWEAVLAEHDELIRAIREGRPDDAAKVAWSHMSAARDVRLKMYSASS
ncbi:MAG: GntR family transcriptional regulator [Actinomycetota bacterium]|nr:GntR family transcriptional regulator [Actinomycetota bacterium]